MRRYPTKGQRWRVSVYPPGVTDNVPTDYPMIHKASREQVTAQAHYDRYAAQIGDGKIGRVIMHQGKLYMGSSQYLHLDTAWGLCAARGSNASGLRTGGPHRDDSTQDRVVR